MIMLISIVYLCTVAFLLYVLSDIAYEEANNSIIPRPMLVRHRRANACLFE